MGHGTEVGVAALDPWGGRGQAGSGVWVNATRGFEFSLTRFHW